MAASKKKATRKKAGKAASKKASDRSHIRARDPQVGKTRRSKKDPGKAERVKECIRVMLALKWRPGRSHDELAERFGVSAETIKHDAAEASRRIREQTFTDEEMKTMCENALLLAMEMGRNARDAARGADSITKAVSAMAGLRGLDAPKEHSVGVTLADFLKLGEGGDAGDSEES